jgi:hypothetical protein
MHLTMYPADLNWCRLILTVVCRLRTCCWAVAIRPLVRSSLVGRVSWLAKSIHAARLYTPEALGVTQETDLLVTASGRWPDC